MRVVTLMPWRPGGNERRLMLWDWTRPFLEELGWDIFEGDDGAEPFSRAGSVNVAAEAAGDWDVALIGDADTIQELEVAHATAKKLHENGSAAQPWSLRYKLNQVGSERLARRGPEEFRSTWMDREDHTSRKGGGGTMMVSRAAWDKVGGMDERFRGYGNEDLAFAAALETLVVGDGVPREDGVIWHLWHKTARFVGSARAATPENTALFSRYQEAHWDQDAMTALLGERR